MILQPKHSTSGKTRAAWSLGCIQEADLVITHMTAIVLETWQVGGLAASPVLNTPVSLGGRTQGADEKVGEESKPQSIPEAPGLAVQAIHSVKWSQFSPQQLMPVIPGWKADPLLRGLLTQLLELNYC